VFIAVNSDRCDLLDLDRNAFEASNFLSLAANNVSFRNLFGPPRRPVRSDAERAITFSEVTARDGTPLEWQLEGVGLKPFSRRSRRALLQHSGFPRRAHMPSSFLGRTATRCARIGDIIRLGNGLSGLRTDTVVQVSSFSVRLDPFRY